MFNLAPESLPTSVKVVVSLVAEVPNRVLIVVAVRLIVAPITVLLTLVPMVDDVFNAVASAVLMPVPVKLDSSLTSPIVAT